MKNEECRIENKEFFTDLMPPRVMPPLPEVIVMSQELRKKTDTNYYNCGIDRASKQGSTQ